MNPNYAVDVAARFGVPTFVLVVGLLTIVPRIDRGIQIADRVDAELQIFIATCAQNNTRPILFEAPARDPQSP